MSSPEIPSNHDLQNNQPSDNSFLSKPSVLQFKQPLPDLLASRLIHVMVSDFLPKNQSKYPDISINPLYSDKHELLGIDFFVNLTPKLKKNLLRQINKYLVSIQQQDIKKYRQEREESGGNFGEPLSFQEMLGTYRVTLNHYYLPLITCIAIATLLAWLSWEVAGIKIDASPVSEQEYGFSAAILNGLIPVIISASFITFLWFIIKKKGLGIFKVIMGVFVLFYNWLFLTWYVRIGLYVLDLNFPEWEPTLVILLNVIIYGTIPLFLYLAVQFFRDKLQIWQKNILILFFGIFLGSVMGTMLPTWSTVMLIIFISLWDLIAVFKGPLGKIANLIQENRKKAVEKEKEQAKLNKESSEQGNVSVSTNNETSESASNTVTDEFGEDEMDPEYMKSHLDEIEIEIGSGDLIFYSALVAHVFINTGAWLKTVTTSLFLLDFGLWFITGLVIFGVIFGAYLTLRQLLQNKRILPALPFSMFIGLAMYGLGTLIIWLLAIA